MLLKVGHIPGISGSAKYPLQGIVFLWNNESVPVEVVFTDEFEAWWNCLDVEEQKSVGVVIVLLEDFGVMLGFPQSSNIEGSKKLRELRIQHQGEPYRVLYAFDPARSAVLLLGGNETGKNRWYERQIPIAERILAAYLKETGQ